MTQKRREELIKLGWDKECVDKYVIESRKKGRFKIVITGDRKDYDDLSELMYNPELGVEIDEICFDTLSQLEEIIEVYEGLFYVLSDNESLEVIGKGILDPAALFDELQEFGKRNGVKSKAKLIFYCSEQSGVYCVEIYSPFSMETLRLKLDEKNNEINNGVGYDDFEFTAETLLKALQKDFPDLSWNILVYAETKLPGSVTYIDCDFQLTLS